MKKAGLMIVILGFLMIFAAASVTPAAAADDYLWTNESAMTRFLAKYYHIDPIVVISLGQRMNFPDDVSVAIYLAKAAERSPMEFLEPRISKKSWMEITGLLKLDPVILFTALPPKTPVPEVFKHAYQEYNKHQKDSAYPIILYDKEFRNLVQLKLMTDAFKKPPQDVMKAVSQGKSFTSLILAELSSKDDKGSRNEDQ
ncbi:MAG: hypothetical protein RDV48_15460 [Candidatus Eremiobacteraeota bacterium]|nr:hypothetical protein [Candidatus Eremiobacteraeota bacterium]